MPLISVAGLLRRERSSSGSYSSDPLQKGFQQHHIHAYKRLNSGSLLRRKHDGCVNTARWSAHDNGRFLVTGSDDLSVILWDCQDYMNEVTVSSEIRTGHMRNIFCAELCHHDPNKVVSCAADGTVRMNDVSSSGGNNNEEILSMNFSITHMFKFDAEQPKVLYVCEERGHVVRIDTREGNSNQTIYKSRGGAHCVKAVAQSAVYGSHNLFVGGQGFVIRELDLRKIGTERSSNASSDEDSAYYDISGAQRQR